MAPEPKKNSKTKPKEISAKTETSNKTNSSTGKGNGTMSPAQQKAIENLAKRRGINDGALEEMSQKQYSVSFNQLPSKEASAFIRYLQQAA